MKETIAELDNARLLFMLYKAANKVSFYNAAEGQYESEREFRKLAKAEFAELLHEASRRGLEFDLKGYLL